VFSISHLVNHAGSVKIGRTPVFIVPTTPDQFHIGGSALQHCPTRDAHEAYAPGPFLIPEAQVRQTVTHANASTGSVRPSQGSASWN